MKKEVRDGSTLFWFSLWSFYFMEERVEVKEGKEMLLLVQLAF